MVVKNCQHLTFNVNFHTICFFIFHFSILMFFSISTFYFLKWCSILVTIFKTRLIKKSILSLWSVHHCGKGFIRIHPLTRYKNICHCDITYLRISNDYQVCSFITGYWDHPYITSAKDWMANIFPILGGFFVNNVGCQSNHFCKTYNKTKCYEKSQIFNLW